MKGGENCMPNMNVAKNLPHSNLLGRRVLSHALPGKRIRLKDDVYKRVREREWILNKIDSDGVHLVHETKAYGMIVRMEDIDWSGDEVKLSEKNSKNFLQKNGFSK
jgi:hypothetical protein